MNIKEEKLIYIEKELDKLSQDERLELFKKYCIFCGYKDPRCQCWNDE